MRLGAFRGGNPLEREVGNPEFCFLPDNGQSGSWVSADSWREQAMSNPNRNGDAQPGLPPTWGFYENNRIEFPRFQKEIPICPLDSADRDRDNGRWSLWKEGSQVTCRRQRSLQ